MLFGGDIRIAKNKKLVTLLGWIQVKITELEALLLKKVQKEFEVLLQEKAELISSSTFGQDLSAGDRMTYKSQLLVTLIENLLDSVL